ncbi:hemin import ATP-binding protein hmuV [Streptomyces clavuligerus]|nr:hemin import ATP-binding protein hmuV [Streptomyces clavuligerus]
MMDEPTSALDARAEHQLFTRLRTLAHGRAATVFITHRLANAAVADRVIVLHNGHVAESGTYQELLAAGSRFAELKDLQDRRTDGTPATASAGTPR